MLNWDLGKWKYRRRFTPKIAKHISLKVKFYSFLNYLYISPVSYFVFILCLICMYL